MNAYLSIHVQPIDFESRDGQLANSEFDQNIWVGVWQWGTTLQVNCALDIGQSSWLHSAHFPDQELGHRIERIFALSWCYIDIKHSLWH